MLSGFVIGYIWQNIEVMKIKMHQRKQVAVENSLQKEIDLIIYQIEKYKNIHSLMEYAKKHNFKKIKAKDVIKLYN
mgnify:CR=1 FL=1